MLLVKRPTMVKDLIIQLCFRKLPVWLQQTRLKERQKHRDTLSHLLNSEKWAENPAARYCQRQFFTLLFHYCVKALLFE